MDVDKTEYLPNLPNDKTGEELLFEQKVFHNNEVFRRIHQDIFNLHLSDENNHFYPKAARNSKNAYETKCQNYIYDKVKNILYQKVTHGDGVGKLQ